MKKFRVLIVDDEPRIVKFLQLKLESSGYETLTASNALEAIEQSQSEEPDLIILDLILPDMDGFETLKQIRSMSSVPVIILSAREASTDKVKGLELGADDYLAKPFSPNEVIARIEAIRRRLDSNDDRKIMDFIQVGDVTINLKKPLVTIDGKEIALTRIEWLLLSELARNAGKLMLYGDLLAKVWGVEYRDDVQILRTWISRLRNKIEQGPNKNTIIRTMPKSGYMIDLPDNQ